MSSVRRKLRPTALLLGKSGVGKGALLARFLETIQPGIFWPEHHYAKEVHQEILEKDIAVCFTAKKWNGGFYEALQRGVLEEVVVVGLCFAVDDPQSLDNVRSYHSELQEHMPEMPVFLVGCKADLRFAGGPVSNEEGKALAEEINAAFYFDCSANDNELIDQIILAAFRLMDKHFKVT